MQYVVVGHTRHCSPDAVHQFRRGRERFTRAGISRRARPTLSMYIASERFVLCELQMFLELL